MTPMMMLIWREHTKRFVSKDKCKTNIKALNLGEKFKDKKGGFMLPDKWLDIHRSHNHHGSTLASELENLFHCAENSPMKFFVKKHFTSWNIITNGQQKNRSSYISGMLFQKEWKEFENKHVCSGSDRTTCSALSSQSISE